MEILLITTLILLFILTMFVGFFTSKLIISIKKEKETEEYIKVAINNINQARYGNFQIQLDEKGDKIGLYKSLNSLFESVCSRDFVINEYREKEKENYNLKEEFIAALTHDLKVPIIAQDKTFNLLLENKFEELTPIQKEVISKLKESNSDLKEMVNSILETYKIENTGIELNIEKNVEVKEFLNSCIEQYKELANSAGKYVELHVKSEDIYADFDKLLIKRVINNLVINAIKHSKTKDKIDIHLNKIADTFSIDVIDYGEGIDKDEIQKIFNKYYSITNKTTRISTGLGLYLSNKIIKKHKGIIEVESKKGEGSIFRIILPIKNS